MNNNIVLSKMRVMRNSYFLINGVNPVIGTDYVIFVNWE